MNITKEEAGVVIKMYEATSGEGITGHGDDLLILRILHEFPDLKCNYVIKT